MIVIRNDAVSTVPRKGPLSHETELAAVGMRSWYAAAFVSETGTRIHSTIGGELHMAMKKAKKKATAKKKK
jgi:hypothetical protein